MPSYLDEDAVEQYAIDLLKALGYAYIHGSDIAPGGAREERTPHQRPRPVPDNHSKHYAIMVSGASEFVRSRLFLPVFDLSVRNL